MGLALSPPQEHGPGMDTRLTPSPPMAPTRPENGTAGQADASHWYTLAGVVLLGGSAFGAISLAIDTAPASVVVAARLWIATLVLSLYAKTTGRPWLPFRNPDGGWNSAWGYAAAIGVIGYAIPMYLFPFAQQTISSLLAGIYMAFMPIATVFLAAIFADEPLTLAQAGRICRRNPRRDDADRPGCAYQPAQRRCHRSGGVDSRDHRLCGGQRDYASRTEGPVTEFCRGDPVLCRPRGHAICYCRQFHRRAHLGRVLDGDCLSWGSAHRGSPRSCSFT